MSLLIKIAIVACLTFGFCVQPSVSLYESSILAFLEEFRARMCHPMPKFGLPALDPLQITHAETAINNQYLIDFNGSITDFRLTGLSDFLVNGLTITVLPLRKSKLDITLPLTVLQSIYTAKGSLAYILNLAGDGNAAASLTEFRISATWNLKTTTSVSISNLNVQIFLNGLFIDFQNLIEEERINDFFHALVNELGLELLGDIWTAENDLVSSTLQTKINNFLGQYTLKEILEIINSAGGGPIFGDDDPPGNCKETFSKKLEKTDSKNEKEN